MNPLLKKWCRKIKYSYNQIQQGQTLKHNLTQDQIKRMEEIGFKWKLTHHVKMTFEKCCRDLEAFKTEFGHCNVPNSCSANPSLGKWCRKMKYSYNQIQQGQNPGMILTQDQIERLEETSFKWIILEAFE